MTLFPTILTDSLETVQKQINLVAGKVEGVQIDIIDGEFADNITVFPIDLEHIDPKGLQIDIHLQTVDPINDVIECESVPNLRTITAQIERMQSQQDFIDHVKSFGWKVGLSYNLHTPIEEIAPDILKQLDAVQVMSIEGGSQGQPFQHRSITKIQLLKELLALHNPTCELWVDGGVNPDNIKQIEKAGATHVVAGSYLWNQEYLSPQNIAESIRKLVY